MQALMYMLFFGYVSISLFLITGWAWKSLTAAKKAAT